MPVQHLVLEMVMMEQSIGKPVQVEQVLLIPVQHHLLTALLERIMPELKVQLVVGELKTMKLLLLILYQVLKQEMMLLTLLVEPLLLMQPLPEM